MQPLARQPDAAPYVGRYRRPTNAVVVRAEGGRVFVRVEPDGEAPEPEMPIAFYGTDRAVVTDGPDKDQSIEFVRAGDGSVRWIRVVGRVALRSSN